MAKERKRTYVVPELVCHDILPIVMQETSWATDVKIEIKDENPTDGKTVNENYGGWSGTKQHGWTVWEDEEE